MKKCGLVVFALTMLSTVALAQSWTPTPMEINVQDVVEYEFDGSGIDIPFSLTGKSGKIWLVIETRLPDEEKPVAVMNGFKGWHFVNGIDTTVYVSTARSYEIGADLVFPWDGTGNEKQYENLVSSGLVAAGDYTYYLWGYDDQSPRELACDFIPISHWWEAQYMRMYTKDDDGSILNNPMLMGTVPFFQMSSSFYGGLINGTFVKWQLGNDPLDISLLETSLAPGFVKGDIYDDHMVGYGAPIFDQNDYDTFYFTKLNYWEHRHTPTKWAFVAGGEAIQDNGWGDFDNIELFHPGNKGDYTLKTPVHTDGATMYILDGGPNPLTYQHNKIHTFPINDPDDYTSFQMDEWYMPYQPSYNGAPRTSSEINRLEPLIGNPGFYYVTGEWTCLTELIDINRIADGIEEPYTPDGTGYVVWANSNGDFFFDKSAYPDFNNPEQLWACIASDPRDANHPRYGISESDMNGLMTGWGEWMGLNSFGVYCPDGTGIELAAFGDEVFSTGGDNGDQKRGYGTLVDTDTQFDGIYVMAAIQAEPRYTNEIYYKTCWFANDSDAGIISNKQAVIEEVVSMPGAVRRGYVHPYCYRWDGVEYVPVFIDEDGTSEGAALEPWEGCWVLLNNENMDCDAIDFLIPCDTDAIPPFTVEPGTQYLFGAPVAGGPTDLNESALGQQLGDGMYEQTWRIGKWQWDVEGYHNYNGPNPAYDELMSLRPGKGFWLQQITDEPITIEVEGTGPAPTCENFFELSIPKNNLDEPYTYHMIGNPFGKPTVWGNWHVRIPVEPLAKVATELTPIEEWHVDLKLVSADGSARDTYNRAGVVTNGDQQMMRAFDLEPIGEYIRLMVTDPESESPEMYAYDYRPDGMGTYTWDITLTTTYDTIETFLSLDNIADVPDGYALVLTDDQSGVSYDVTDEYSLPVTLSDGLTKTYTLVATNQPVAVEVANAPITFGIQSTVPNPFNPMTTILYTLAEDSDVEIRVYNVSGQLVDTLVDTYTNAGMQSVVWNAQGQASGLYFIALTANGHRDVTKVMLMK